MVLVKQLCLCEKTNSKNDDDGAMSWKKPGSLDDFMEQSRSTRTINCSSLNFYVRDKLKSILFKLQNCDLFVTGV